MNLIKILPMFMLLVFAVGCVQEGAEETQTPEETAPETAQPETAPPGEEGELQLDITFSKETYSVGEEIEGDYDIKYDGEPFEGIIHYNIKREGFEKDSDMYMGGYIDNLDFEAGRTNYLKAMLQAVKINETGFYGKSDSFPFAGTYVYSIIVYDCADVEAEFGTCDLFDLETDELAETITPVGEFSKTMEVIGG